MGVNSLRCAFLNGFESVFLLLAAAFYAAKQFGLDGELQTVVNEAYPYICTCQEDVKSLEQYFPGDGDTSAFSACVEE